jgi:hypothetical protein
MDERIKNTISLELTRFIDKDYGCKHSVLTIKVDNNMVQKTGIEAEALFSMVKDLVDTGEELKFEEDEDETFNS